MTESEFYPHVHVDVHQSNISTHQQILETRHYPLDYGRCAWGVAGLGGLFRRNVNMSENYRFSESHRGTPPIATMGNFVDDYSRMQGEEGTNYRCRGWQLPAFRNSGRGPRSVATPFLSASVPKSVSSRPFGACSSPQGLAGFGAAGILNLDSSTGAFSLTSANFRAETGLPTSIDEVRAMKGNLIPSTSR